MSGQITDLSRPAIANHLLKGAVFGGICGAALYFAPRFGAPWMYGFWVVAYLAAAAVLRNLHALVVFPRFVMSREGLRLRYWRPTGFLTWGMWRPWNRVADLTIPWPLFSGCRTFERSGGDPWDAWQALYVDTEAGSLLIGWDVFSRSVDDLMSAVSEYRELEFRRPLRNALRVNDFQRRRFEQPLRLEVPKVAGNLLIDIFFGLILTVFVGGPLALLAFGGLMAAYKAGILGTVLLVVGGIVGAIVLLNLIFRDRGVRLDSRVLEFRADGLALGPNENSLTLFPWEDVLYTRLLELSLKSSRGGESKSTTLKLHLRGARPVTISNLHLRPLAEISDLLDPPLHKVQDAWQRFDELHEDIETAALNAGLPATRAHCERKATSLLLA